MLLDHGLGNNAEWVDDEILFICIAVLEARLELNTASQAVEAASAAATASDSVT